LLIYTATALPVSIEAMYVLNLSHDPRGTNALSDVNLRTQQQMNSLDHCNFMFLCIERTTSLTGSDELPSEKHLDSDPLTTPVSAMLVPMTAPLDESVAER
jgi:hypothetical protein